MSLLLSCFQCFSLMFIWPIFCLVGLIISFSLSFDQKFSIGLTVCKSFYLPCLTLLSFWPFFVLLVFLSICPSFGQKSSIEHLFRLHCLYVFLLSFFHASSNLLTFFLKNIFLFSNIKRTQLLFLSLSLVVVEMEIDYNVLVCVCWVIKKLLEV